MLIQKQCKCGLVANTIDNKFKINELGYWLECECESTLFLDHDTVNEIMAEQEVADAE